jgi:hypothetical protein
MSARLLIEELIAAAITPATYAGIVLAPKPWPPFVAAIGVPAVTVYCCRSGSSIGAKLTRRQRRAAYAIAVTASIAVLWPSW